MFLALCGHITIADRRSSPGFTAGLHVVGERDVIGPDVVLPLAQAQHAAKHAPRMDAYTHVQLDICRLNHGPGEDTMSL